MNEKQFKLKLSEIALDNCEVGVLKSPTHETNGEDIPEIPKSSDLDFAYEVINGRIITGKKTIISSEYYLSEVARYEAAVCGRIHGMTDNGRYVVTVKRDSGKKYSLQR